MKRLLARGDFDAACALSIDTEGLVGQLMAIRGVSFAMLLSELEPGRVKVSFRSDEGAVPAALVARSLGGGGHPRASGATLEGPLEEALERVRSTLKERHAEWLAAR